MTGHRTRTASPRTRASRATGRAALAQIEKGELQPAYFLLGEDAVTAELLIARLKEKALTPGLEAFDFDSLDANEAREEDFQQRLLQLPVGERRLVVINGITRMGKRGPVFSSLGKKGVERLCEAVAGAAGTGKKRGGGKGTEARKAPVSAALIVAVTGLWTKELAALLQQAGLTKFAIDIGRPGPGELGRMVRDWAMEAGISVNPAATDLLVDISGEDTATLKGEVEKLATCLAPGTEASPEDVRELAGSSRAYELREYVNLVLKRDAAGAMAVLRRLEEAGEKIPGIVTWLTSGLLDLVRANAGALPYWAKRRLDGAEQRWKRTDELNVMLQRLYRIEKSLFEGKPETFVRLELWTFCVGCGSKAGWCDLYKDDRQWRMCPRSKRRSNNG